jgi:hypothetical protein
MVIAMGIGFSAFPVLLLSAAVNSRFVAKFGLSLIMVPFLVISSMIAASAFTARRQTFRVRLGLVGVGLLIFVPASFALLGIWF